MSQEEVIHINFACSNLSSECAIGVRIAVGAVLDDGNTFTEIGQTETVAGHINPVFQTHVSLVVRLDLDQRLKFMLYRVNAETEIIIEKYGEIELNILQLLTTPGSVSLALKHFSNASFHSFDCPPLIIANATIPDSYSRGTVMQFAGEALSPGGKLKIAPYFTMELVPNSSEKIPIMLYRSESAVDCECPRWREFVIPTNFFASNAEWSLQISCFNFNNNAEDLLIGRFTTTFYQLLNSTSSNKFILRKGVKKTKGGDAVMELLRIWTREDTPSFLNIFKSGLQMHFTIAVDFTANNGGPTDIDSLHFIHPHTANAYMSTLSGIAPTLMKFDKLNRVSLLGFGAKVPPKFELSQLFALNGDLNNSHVKGLSEVLHFYKNNAITLMPFAPTEYSGVIHHVIKLAKASVRASVGYYFTLVIVTNGGIRNVRDTVDTIVQASELPMSIVFVLIGNAKYSVGNCGNISNVMQLLSPCLKSTNNTPLKREVVSVVVVNNHAHQQTALPLVSFDGATTQQHQQQLSFITQRIFASVPRQAVLWALQNRNL